MIPPQPGFRITKLRAYTSIGKDDEEGIVAFMMHGVWYPLICADEERFKQMREKAVEIANVTGREVRVVEFATLKELEIIKPEPKPSFG